MIAFVCPKTYPVNRPSVRRTMRIAATWTMRHLQAPVSKVVDTLCPKAHNRMCDPGAIVCGVRCNCVLEDRAMHAVIRTYSGNGAKELFDLLERRKSDVESVIRPVKGFVGYVLIRTDEGGVSVTVCQDKTGTDESVQRARDWIKENASGIGTSAPKVTEGQVILQV